MDTVTINLEDPDQPVAWGMLDHMGEIYDVISPTEHLRLPGHYTVPLYARPQRLWVGLTEEEVDELQSGLSASHADVRAIEALLREKNT